MTLRTVILYISVIAFALAVIIAFGVFAAPDTNAALGCIAVGSGLLAVAVTI